MKLFIRVNNIINENIKIESNKFITCSDCGFLLGLKFVKIKNKKDTSQSPQKRLNTIPENSNYSDQTEYYYFLKKKILIKNENNIKIGLLGIKPDKLELIKKLLTNFSDKKVFNKPSTEFYILKQTKESLQNFKSKDAPMNLDIIFIIHKVEGRLFLLGRNGFYNKVCEQMNSKSNIYFILLYKNIYNYKCNLEDYNNIEVSLPCQFQSESIDNLINKGDQIELQRYKDQNKIICLDDEMLEDDLNRRIIFFENLMYKKLITFTPYKDKKSSVMIYSDEIDLLDELSKRLKSNAESNSIFKCSIL